MRGKIVGALALVALLAAAAPAAAVAPIRTTVTVDVGIKPSEDFLVLGHLSSPNHKCLAGRTVKLFFVYPSGKRLVDTGRTSTRGIFGVGGDSSGVSAGRVTVTRKRIGTRTHPKFCGAASIVID
ncbi:MAG: hypothetical protein U0R52_12105 [Solirubrobacterales bacterium]